MWRKVLEADLTASLALNEIDAFRTSADFEHDPVESQIRQVCGYVRGCIRPGGAKVRMAREEDWLPESLISPAMDYAAFKLLKRRNVKVNADRETAYNDAMTYFRDVAAGKVNPESYGSATTDTTGGPAVEIVTSSRPRTDASRLEGL